MQPRTPYRRRSEVRQLATRSIKSAAAPGAGRKGGWLIKTAAVLAVLAGTALGVGAIASRRLFSQLPGYNQRTGADR